MINKRLKQREEKVKETIGEGKGEKVNKRKKQREVKGGRSKKNKKFKKNEKHIGCKID